MSNGRSATVIVLDGLRSRVRCHVRLAVRHTSTSRPCLLAGVRLLQSAYSTSAFDRRLPHEHDLDTARRLLRWPPLPTRDEEIDRVVRTAEPARLYELLRIAAANGEFRKVQIYAETLMRSHGEEPNLRIYSALILANSHPHGSIASVKDYIRQLRADGLDLDLGACHDIIKVGAHFSRLVD
jgi:hypothetical protein